MAGPKGQELGLRSPFSIRVGITHAELEGVNTQRDPGAIRDVQLQDGINIRLTGGRVVNRGGQSKLHSNDLGDENICIRGIFDVPFGGGGAQAYVFGGVQLDPGGPHGGHVTIGRASRVNTDDPALEYKQDLGTGCASSAAVDVGSTVQICAAVLTDGMRTSSTPGLYVTAPGAVPPKSTAVKFGDRIFTYSNEAGDVYEFTRVDGIASYRKLFTCGSRISDVICVQERVVVGTEDAVLNVLYLGGWDSGNLYRYDEVSGLTTDGTGFGATRQILSYYRDKVVIANDATLRIRTAVGTYTSVAWPVGMVAAFPTDLEVYKDVLYISFKEDSAPAKVLVAYSGTTTSVVHTIAPPLGGITACYSLASFNGYLYFTHSQYVIGRFDNSTWTDTHATGLPNSAWGVKECRLKAFGDAFLFLNIVGDQEEFAGWLGGYLISNGVNTSSGWSYIADDELQTSSPDSLNGIDLYGTVICP